MHELSDAQEEFLLHHKIPYSHLLDADGRTVNQVLDFMYTNEKYYAYNTKKNICVRGHEAIRKRKIHCIQCDPERIAHYMRNYQAGLVYVAISLNEKFIKIGSTTNVDSRLSQIRNEEYGGISDWVLLLRISTSNAGNLEFKIQSDLFRHSVPGKFYKKRGMPQVAREVFKVEYDIARQTAIANCSKIELESMKEDMDLIRKMSLHIS